MMIGYIAIDDHELYYSIGMAAPGMVFIPVIINNLDRKGLFRQHPRLSAPLQVFTFFDL